MVSASRSSTSQRRREVAGNIFLGGLVLLGLIASVFLIFGQSVQYMRLGLVVALWAAVLGAWAVSRYRTRLRDLRHAYTVQLEREISARREYELGLESRIRAEAGLDNSEVAALRAELSVLRQQLHRLFDGDLPEDRPALRAEAVRLPELPSAHAAGTGLPLAGDDDSGAVDSWVKVAAGWSAAAGGWSAFDTAPEPTVDKTPGTSESGPATPVYDPHHPDRPHFADPDDAPVTAETTIVRLDDDPAGVRVEVNGPGWADAFTEITDPVADEAVPPGLDHAVYGPPRWGDVVQGPPRPLADTAKAASDTSEPRPVPTATRPAEPARQPHRNGSAAERSMGSASSRRRRRTKDSNGSRRLSVAEIMANLRQEEEQRSS